MIKSFFNFTNFLISKISPTVVILVVLVGCGSSKQSAETPSEKPPKATNPEQNDSSVQVKTFENGKLEATENVLTLHVSGTPEEMGRQNGTLLKDKIKLMIDTYLMHGSVIENDPDDPKRKRMMAGVRKMRTALPKSFVTENDACAKAAGVDPDILLLAQCEGDMRSAVMNASNDELPACSGYVAFGPATVDGRMEFGRNLDYWVDDTIVTECALTTYYNPKEGDGYKFAVVGWTGILTGWTFVNEHGVVVANHLGGGYETRLDAVPTLYLSRLVAQYAKTVEEGIALLKKWNRMRGQIIWIAQDKDEKTKRPARAVAVEYDAKEIKIREAENGILIVTNTNRIFREAVPEDEVYCSRYRTMRETIQNQFGKLNGTDPLNAHTGVANTSTLHMVHGIPSSGFFSVYHGKMPAKESTPIQYPVPANGN